MQKRLGSALAGAVATAALPASAGMYDWRVLCGAAVAGAIGGWFGVDVAGRVKRAMPRKAKETP